MQIPTYDFEKELWKEGKFFVAGADEVGRGAWAGPLLAAAVILPVNKKLRLLRDSKMLNAHQREVLAKKIKKEAVAWAIGSVEIEEINKLKNIYLANVLALERALLNLSQKFDHVLLDGKSIKNFNFKHTAIIKGDAKCCSIAAASIIAKVARDALMEKIDLEFPGYGFAENKGYGTKKHQEALEKFGSTKMHRLHFAPLLPKLF